MRLESQNGGGKVVWIRVLEEEVEQCAIFGGSDGGPERAGVEAAQ